MADSPFKRGSERLETALKETCEEISVGVISDTPIKSGFLVNSWYAVTTDRAPKNPVEKPALYNNATPSEAIGQVNAVTERVTIKGSVSYALYNNAEYAAKIESGENSQTGKHMVKRNTSRFKTVFVTKAKR